MSKSITFTLDLEDHLPDERSPKRYPEITDQILQFLDDHNIKATIFTVGTLAQENPNLIRKIYNLGHEIAHHSYNHTALDKQTPEEFYKDTKHAKDILENIIGSPVYGYRAPVFSLTPQTIWAIDIIKDLGFSYSSSILPAKNPLHGFQNAPKEVFQWHNGLIEIPAPITQIGSVNMPYLGGFYLRYLPLHIIQKSINQANDNQALWTYCHPYDFDPDEKNWRIKGASIPVSLLLWFNRKNTFKKLEKIAEAHHFSVPFKDQRWDKNLKVIDPNSL